MAVRRLLAALARSAPVPVFAVAGRGARLAVSRLRLDHRVTLVDTPRHASVLLLAGELPEALTEPVRRIHDEVASPRATVVWSLEPSATAAAVLEPARVVDGDDRDAVVDAVVALGHELRSGTRPTEPDLLADVDPAEWRGVGPYGQGGKGMTGGVPYGRPMAGRAADRDLLELDQLPLRVGPVFPAFPPGLVVDVLLQGDVIQGASIPSNPFGSASPSDHPASMAAGVFAAALVDEVSLAELELARARHHLRWLSEALRIAGLPDLALRVLATADRVRPHDTDEVRAIGRRIDRDVGLRLSHRGVGITDPSAVAGLGPVARAAGVPDDARAADPVYQRIGFEPVAQSDGDVRARWRQRIAEATQALVLAERAGDTRWAGTVVEGPRGPIGGPNGGPAGHETAIVADPAVRLCELATELVVGQEWGDAVATIVSLDLDLEDAAASWPAGGDAGGEGSSGATAAGPAPSGSGQHGTMAAAGSS